MMWLAIFNDKGKPYPPTAQMAVQQGEYMANQLLSYIRSGKMKVQPFSFDHKGTLASLGKGEAVGSVGNRKFYGATASLMKQMIDNRYLYSLGGIPLVIKKGKLLG